MKAAYDDFLRRVQKEGSVKIYGAGKFAKTLCYLLERNNIHVEAFIVTDIQINPTKLLKRPVLQLDTLKLSERCNIIVGFEKKDDMKEITGFLLKKQVKNIIMVSPDIVNEIYCNFVIDGSSANSLCRELKSKKTIIAYMNDSEGEIVIRYLMDKGIPIEAVCTDLTDIVLNYDMIVVPFEQITERDKCSTIVLTMNSIYWQRSYITKLRKAGFEDIVLISDEIMKTIKADYRRMMWEGRGTGFQLIESPYVEIGHYIVQKKENTKIYRWRIPKWDTYPYTKETMKTIRNGMMLKDYKKQFPGCNFLPYTETSLCSVKNPGIHIEVYMAKFHGDKKTEQAVLPDWVIPIQVGKALTDIRIAEICDNTGDNISEMNADYSEGTALYWMWKNTCGQDYVGLFHYRRQMAMGTDFLEKLEQYDVLLTVPTYVSVSLKDFFCTHYILEHDWELMMQYIKSYNIVYYETALKYEQSHCYFPCNLFIIRRRYFDEMCAFIFGVLEKVSAYYEKLHMIRKDRYLGFLVENLLAIYMMHHAEQLKMAYTDMKYYNLLMEKKHV